MVLYIGYWGYGKATNTTGETQYVTTTVQKGTIVSSVSASGQVESSNQIDLKANVSGTITYVGVKPGDIVYKGKTLFSIDNGDAQKAVRDAEINLQSAQISLDKFKLQNSNDSLNTDLSKAYEDGFNTVSNTFLDLSDVMTGIESILNNQELSDNVARMNGKTALDYRNKAEDTYYDAKNSFDENRRYYITLTHDSPKEDIEKIINQTYAMTSLTNDAIKNLRTYIVFMTEDTENNSSLSSYQSTLLTYKNTTTGYYNDLLTSETTIKNSKDSFTNTDLDLQSSELSVKQKENALQDAKDKLKDYYVFAPFNGTIASVIAKVGDTSSGTLGSIITNQQIATLSMNEVDVAKIKLGQKATITFDAIDNLSLTGYVAQIDTIGTVSQGVVSYNVKIAFDTENSQVKPGMSVSASIITNSKTDVLIVPSSAIKNQGVTKYVQMFTPPLASPTTGSLGTPSKVAPSQVIVETGISDDTNTEIVSGLKEGDQIVSRTITSTTTSTASTSSLLGGGGTRAIGGAGGFER